jgi:RHS repeat-associated protein
MKKISENVVDYYPYGKVLRAYQNGQQERYLTTGNERDRETGWDFRNARSSDADNGRFNQIDPLSDAAPGWSPYRYGFCNPVNFIDPTGMYEESSDIGPRDAPIAGASTAHPGMDIVQPYKGTVEGASVVAPVNMKILSIKSASDGNGAGNRIHARAVGDNKVRTFMHLEDNNLGGGYSVGSVVPRGNKIGQVGNTGNSAGAHLHFEIRDNIASGTIYNPRNKNEGLRNAPTTQQVRSSIAKQQAREDKINRTPGHSKFYITYQPFFT